MKARKTIRSANTVITGDVDKCRLGGMEETDVSLKRVQERNENLELFHGAFPEEKEKKIVITFYCLFLSLEY